MLTSHHVLGLSEMFQWCEDRRFRKSWSKETRPKQFDWTGVTVWPLVLDHFLRTVIMPKSLELLNLINELFKKRAHAPPAYGGLHGLLILSQPCIAVANSSLADRVNRTITTLLIRQVPLSIPFLKSDGF